MCCLWLAASVAQCVFECAYCFVRGALVKLIALFESVFVWMVTILSKRIEHGLCAVFGSVRVVLRNTHVLTLPENISRN